MPLAFIAGILDVKQILCQDKIIHQRIQKLKLLDRHEETQTYTEGEHTHSGGGHSTGEGGGDGTHSHSGGGHSHKSKDYVDKLKVGDKVIMLRENDMFYIISKVVKF